MANQEQPEPRPRGNPAWRKGAASPNPGGRPKGAAGLSKYIAEQTDGGRELVDRLLHLARGKATTREVAPALLALLDRLVGKPAQTVDMMAVVAAATAPSLPAGWATMTLGERTAWLDKAAVQAIDAIDVDDVLVLEGNS